MSAASHFSGTGHYVVTAGTAMVAVWLLATLKLETSLEQTARSAVAALLIVQWFVVFVCAPQLTSRSGLGGVTLSMLGVLMIPWPLFILCQQISGQAVGQLLWHQLLILFALIVCYLAARWLQKFRSSHWYASAQTSLQLLPLLALLAAWQRGYAGGFI